MQRQLRTAGWAVRGNMNVLTKNVSVPTGSLGHKCPFAVSAGMGSQGDGREREERAGSGTTWKEQGKDKQGKGRGEVGEEVKSDGQRDAEMAGYGKLLPAPQGNVHMVWRVVASPPVPGVLE